MDRIFIEGLQVEALIGVYDWERDTPQPLLIDLELHTNLQTAADSDQVADTVDYAKVAGLLQLVASQSQFELLEALAQKMIIEVMQRFSVAKVCIKLSKPNILDNAKHVSVSMCRDRTQYAEKLNKE